MQEGVDIARPLKAGTIGCPKMSLISYNPALHNIAVERRTRYVSMKHESSQHRVMKDGTELNDLLNGKRVGGRGGGSRLAKRLVFPRLVVTGHKVSNFIEICDTERPKFTNIEIHEHRNSVSLFIHENTCKSRVSTRWYTFLLQPCGSNWGMDFGVPEYAPWRHCNPFDTLRSISTNIARSLPALNTPADAFILFSINSMKV